MTARFAGPLEARPNPSRWALLLDLALPALDHALPDEMDRLARGDVPRWTLGGGTALALRLGHRVSDDVDIFLSGVRLAELSPARNPHAKAIDPKPDWPGHFLKFHRPEGEIDFLGTALQTLPGFSSEIFRGRTIALETIEEVMVKKLRYRAAQFTLRDAFDLACVLRAKPEIALALATEAGDTVPRAKLALNSLSDEKVRSAVRADPAFGDILSNPIELAQKGLDRIAFLKDNPISEHILEEIAEAATTVDRFGPGARVGSIRLTWDNPALKFDEEKISIFYKWHEVARLKLFDAWRRTNPDQFSRWDSDGRPAVSRQQRFAVRSGSDLDL